MLILVSVMFAVLFILLSAILFFVMITNLLATL